MLFGEKKKKTGLIDIDLTPAIDAIFNLIIFFMLTLTMKPPLDSEIILPRTVNYTEQKDTEIKIYIKAPEVNEVGEITTPGEMCINEKSVTIATLKEEIRKQVKFHNKKKLIIKADRYVFYRTISEVMKFAKKVGIEEFAIATSSELTGVGGSSRAFKYYGEK